MTAICWERHSVGGIICDQFQEVQALRQKEGKTASSVIWGVDQAYASIQNTSWKYRFHPEWFFICLHLPWTLSPGFLDLSYHPEQELVLGIRAGGRHRNE